MSKELEDKAEELEQTLSKQLDLLKKDSEQWVKIGAVALAGGLIAYAITSRRSRKKNRETEKAIAVLEKEGLLTEELEHKLKSSNKSGGFWPSLSQRLMILGLAMAKEKLLPNLFSNPSEDAEEIEKGK